MSPMPVSVLVLSRGRPERLRACLDSVRSQDYPSIEIRVLANGCPETAALVRREYPRVILDETSENIGCAPGRNRLAAATDAPLLVFLDDDGELRSTDVLSRLVRVAAADGRVGVVGMGLLNAADDEPTGWRRTQGRLPYSCYHSSFAGGACLIRREAFEAAGGYSEAFRGFGEEFDLTVRLYAAGWAVRYEPDVCFHHHVDKTDEEWRLQLSQGYQHLQYTIRRLYPTGWSRWAAWKALLAQTLVDLRHHGGRHLWAEWTASRAWGRRGIRDREPVTHRALELVYFAKYFRVDDWDTLETAPAGLLRRLPWLRLRRRIANVPKLPLPPGGRRDDTSRE